MDKRIEELVIEYQPKFEEFIYKLRETGLLSSQHETLKLMCGGTMVYIGGKEIEDMRIKANCFDRMTEVMRGENND